MQLGAAAAAAPAAVVGESRFSSIWYYWLRFIVFSEQQHNNIIWQFISHSGPHASTDKSERKILAAKSRNFPSNHHLRLPPLDRSIGRISFLFVEYIVRLFILYFANVKRINSSPRLRSHSRTHARTHSLTHSDSTCLGLDEEWSVICNFGLRFGTNTCSARTCKKFTSVRFQKRSTVDSARGASESTVGLVGHRVAPT